MIRLLFFYLFFVGFSTTLLSQTAPDKYWVQFTDKNNTPFTLENPTDYLSEKSIAKRLKFQIDIDSLDLPVLEEYIEGVLSMGEVELLNTSKWFNAISIEADSITMISILDLTFVNQIKSVVSYIGNPEVESHERNLYRDIDFENEYGKSWEQTSMVGGHLLHELGFTGKGIDIAILDAGFDKSLGLSVFAPLLEEDRLIDSRDFVFNNGTVFGHSNHGTSVWSIMAGFEKDSLIGSAYEANYYLFRTEKSSSEFIIEEDNWVSAAEHCDYLGIDVINTSLGYTTFEDSLTDHTYEDMDGNTTRITIATDIASSKGILAVTSAGNSGNNDWHFISAPADGDLCLTVGATDSLGVHASFSSFGPTFDGRVKPDIVAMGRQTAYAFTDGTIRRGNGTSFSSPLMAGFTACLMQAHPNKSNHELIQAIRESASLYDNPNDSMGYGIPNMWEAHKLLLADENPLYWEEDINLMLYPNPFTDRLSFHFDGKDITDYEVSLFTISGKLVFKSFYHKEFEGIIAKSIDKEIQYLASGIYILEINLGNRVIREKVFKVAK